jgi:hypothetical protein
MKGRDFQPEVAFSLLNTQDTADVQTPASTDLVIITGLPAFHTGEYLGYTSEAAVAETAQVARITGSGITLVAATRYTIKWGNSSTQEFGHMGLLKPVSTMSPATLGTAATDKHNIFVDLARKINLDPRNFLTAYPVVTVTHAAGTFNVGEVLTGATSGATGIVISAASGTCNVRLTSLSPYKIFTPTENVDDVTGAGPFASITCVLGVSLDLVDDGGYYNAKGTKSGATTISVEGGNGWSSAFSIVTAAVYSKGQAADLTARIPVLERTSSNLASGQWNMATNNAPIAGATYIKYSIKLRKYAQMSASQSNGASAIEQVYVVWTKTGASGQANFQTAIAAL